jgi:hypothetical protein
MDALSLYPKDFSSILLCNLHCRIMAPVLVMYVLDKLALVYHGTERLKINVIDFLKVTEAHITGSWII